MTKRAIGLGGLGAALLLATGLTSPQANAETVFKIGNILSLTGVGASIGQHMEEGENLWLKLHAKDLPGIKVELLTRDDASKADTTRRLAQELVVRDHVGMIAGITLSPQGFSVAKVATEAKIPVVIMNATTGSITRASPYLVRFSHSNWQMSYPLGQYAATHGIKTAYSMVADYVAGTDMEAAFVAGFESKGGKMLGADHTPLSTSDFLPYMQRVKAAKPQGLFVFEISGRSTVSWFKSFGDAKLKQAGITVVGTGDTVPEDELPQTGPEADGMITASIYAAGIKNPQNAAFLADWKKVYGATEPTFESVAAWNAMHGIFNVLKKVGPHASGAAMMAVFKGMKLDGPNGPIEIDPQTRDIIQNVYMGKVEKVDGKWENVLSTTIPMIKDPWKVLHPVKK